MEIPKEKNKELCKQYPFLIPWNRWSGKLITDCAAGEKGYWPGEPDKLPEYDYEYTELDNMPDGWRIAFGEQMCEEIREALIDDGDLDKYRTVEIKEKYGCYDEKTEVLTRAGWKYFQDVTLNDEFATLDNDGETLVYQHPTDIIIQHYDGKMYHLENRGINLFVTENHKLYVAKGSYYNHSKENEKRLYDFELTTPDTYFGKDKRFKKGAKWVGNNPYGEYFKIPGYTRTNEMVRNHCTRTYNYPSIDVPLVPWLRFLGFYIAEGHTDLKNGNGTQITLAYNPADEESIVSDLIHGILQKPAQAGRGCKRFHNTVIANWLRKHCGHLAPNKKVPDFIKDLPPELIHEFLTYLYLGDGHNNSTSNVLTTTSKQLCDDVCELLVKEGSAFGYYVREREPCGSIEGRTIVTKHHVYEINWLKLTEVEIDNSKHSAGFVEQWEDYCGMVYCVTVPSHKLYVRRGGKGVWCGNSLRWYDNGCKVGSKVHDIIRKYEHMSAETCIVCGKPATRITLGWISPFCDDCCLNCGNGKSVSIEEYYKKDEEE